VDLIVERKPGNESAISNSKYTQKNPTTTATTITTTITIITFKRITQITKKKKKKKKKKKPPGNQKYQNTP
jgi:hypothetical protein